MAVAVIVAAGRGERLGQDRPKALVELAGRPMLEWSVDALLAVAAVERIVVVLPPGELDAAPAETVAIAGGTLRAESVRNGIGATDDGDPIIIHDAARPLAGAELFERALAALASSDADGVIVAAPISDTIKEATPEGATVMRTLDRSRLWGAQTPQIFRRAALLRALEELPEELLEQATDEAWVIERAGGRVELVEPGGPNFKVTTATDLHLAEMLLRDR